jgi:hypothetical protein
MDEKKEKRDEFLTAKLKRNLDMMHFAKQNHAESDIEKAEFDVIMRWLQMKVGECVKEMKKDLGGAEPCPPFHMG